VVRSRQGDCICELSPEAFARLVSRFSHGVITTIECIDSKSYILTGENAYGVVSGGMIQIANVRLRAL
jgi:hypothetical protein